MHHRLEVVEKFEREAARGRYLALALLVTFVFALFALEAGDEVVQAKVAFSRRKGLLETVLDHMAHAGTHGSRGLGVRHLSNTKIVMF